ncbi:uncharacterized protein LOC142332714 isoform X2 [Lycorma delicatula]|uniref:uncharacterized protein LOC142332714 isoform X2 n=1 Tax=Lycorma delicatula TaxID=130591 RepID=UPI003F51310C
MTGLFSSIKTLVHGEDTSLRFSVTPSTGTDTGFNQWLAGMKMVAQLPEGIPQEFRRTLWLTLAEKHLAARGVDWAQAQKICFNEWANPDDEELGVQIVKDLHRTGCSLFCGVSGQHNQAVLRRVLLAYARWNKAVGYCQGFNMLGALILQVMDRSEIDSVKVMIYLIEGVLPESYFANNLRGLSVDMAVFRDLLRLKLPVLSRHLEQLQSDSKDSGTSYEPPLTNVFTMQWFLTLFCNCLPQDTVLRVWDLVFLEGNSILLRTALAIWNTLSDRILSVESADEFYSIMGVLTREMLEFGLMDTNNLIKAVVSINLPELNEMRERYMYNITPWTQSVSTVARRGLRLFYTEDDTDTDEDDEKIAIATAYALFRSPKRKDGGSGSSSSQMPHQSPSRQVHTLQSERERVVMDISALKKQYSKLRERQRQAHIILTAACGGQSIVGPSSGPAMNHLLLGKSALVNNRGRRLGPPPGTVPPPPTSTTKQLQANNTGSGETLHWKDTNAEGKKSKSHQTAEYSTTPDSTSPPTSSCSSRRSSSSSTSTELCDEPGRMSDSDSISDCYPLPDTSNTSKGRLSECKEEETTTSNYDKVTDSDFNDDNVSEPINIENNDKKKFPEQELDKVLFPFDRDYLTKYGSEDSSDLCISSCPASPCVFPEEELRDENDEICKDIVQEESDKIIIASNDNNEEKTKVDEIISCNNDNIELISTDNKMENNILSSSVLLEENVQNKNELPVTSNTSLPTTIRDSHSFHGITSFDDHHYKIKRKSLQCNYKDRYNTDDEDLELRKIWLEKCNSSSSSNNNTNIFVDNKIKMQIKNVTDIKSNELVSPDDNLKKNISVYENIDRSSIASSIKDENIISIKRIDEEEEGEENNDIKRTKQEHGFTKDEEEKFKESKKDGHSSITDDENINIKESQLIVQQSYGRRGSEVQLNQILKENLEIIQKIQHTRRQKLSSPPTATEIAVLKMNEEHQKEIINVNDNDESISSFVNENKNTTADRLEEEEQILKNSNDIFDKLFLKNYEIEHDNDVDEKTIITEISTSTENNSTLTPTLTLINDKNDSNIKKNDFDKDINRAKSSSDITKEYDKEYNHEENTIKKKSSYYFIDDKTNSTVSLTEISSTTDVSSVKHDSSTDVDTSFESSFDNSKIDNIRSDESINSSSIDIKSNLTYDKNQSSKSTSPKPDYFTSSSTSEEKNQKINRKSYIDTEFDAVNINKENIAGYSSKFISDDDKFKKYRGTSLNIETMDKTSRSSDEKKLSRIKNYYSFDYSPKSKVSSSSFYDINKRRTSYSLDSGTNLPFKITVTDGNDEKKTKAFNLDYYDGDDDNHDKEKTFRYWKSKTELEENSKIIEKQKDRSDYLKTINYENISNDDIGATSMSYSNTLSSTNKYTKFSSDLKSDPLIGNDFQYQPSKLFDENNDDFLSKYITRKEDLSFKFSSSPSSSISLSKLESNRSVDSYLQPSSSYKLQRSESLDTNEYIRSKSPRSIRRSLSPRYDLGKTLEESSDDFENWKIESSKESVSPKLSLRKTVEEISVSDDLDRWKTSFSRDSSPKSRDIGLGKTSLTETSDDFDSKRIDIRSSRESSPILRDLNKKFDDNTDDIDKWQPTKRSRESSPKTRDSRYIKAEDILSDDIDKYKSPYARSRESSPKSRESYLTKKYSESEFDKWKSTKSSRESSPISREVLLTKSVQESSDDFEKWKTLKKSRETSPVLRETNLRSDDIYSTIKSKSNEVSPKRISPDLRNIGSVSLLETEKKFSTYIDEVSKDDNILMDTVRKKDFDDFQRTLATMERSSTLQDDLSTDIYDKIKTTDEKYFGKLNEIDDSFKILSKSQTLDDSYKTTQFRSSMDLSKEIKSDESKYSFKKYSVMEPNSFDTDRGGKSSKRSNSERRSTIHEYYHHDRFTSSSSRFLDKNVNDKSSLSNSDLKKDSFTVNEDKPDSFTTNNEIYKTRQNQQQQSNNLINKNITDLDSCSSTAWKLPSSSTESKNCDNISSTTKLQQQFSSSTSIQNDSTIIKTKQTSPNSPSRFNPFPSRSITRQPKEIGVKLGLYSPTKPTDLSKSKLSTDKSNIINHTTTAVAITTTSTAATTTTSTRKTT